MTRIRAARTTGSAVRPDVSMGGMFIETTGPAAPGESVIVTFCAECFPVEVEAQVIYGTHGVGMGVKFGRLQEVDRTHLEMLIDRIQNGS